MEKMNISAYEAIDLRVPPCNKSANSPKQSANSPKQVLKEGGFQTTTNILINKLNSPNYLPKVNIAIGITFA